MYPRGGSEMGRPSYLGPRRNSSTVRRTEPTTLHTTGRGSKASFKRLLARLAASASLRRTWGVRWRHRPRNGARRGVQGLELGLNLEVGGIPEGGRRGRPGLP